MKENWRTVSKIRKIVLGCHKIINVYSVNLTHIVYLDRILFSFFFSFFFFFFWCLALLMDKAIEGDVCNATPRKDRDNVVCEIAYQEVNLYRSRCQIVPLKQFT